MAAGVQLLLLLLIVEYLPSDSSAHVGSNDPFRQGTPEVFYQNLGFLVEPSDQVVGKGRPLRLDCIPVPAIPRPFTVTWIDGYIDGPMLPVNDSRVKIENGSLNIRKYKGFSSETSDIGTFSCLVTSQIGSILSRPARVRFANISKTFSELPQNVTAGEGDTVRLSCQINSFPTAVISWQKNNDSLPQDPRYILLKSGVLYINNSQISDSGEYRCIANNPEVKKTRYSSSGHLTVVRTNSLSSSTSKRLMFLTPSPPINPIYLKQNDSTQLECSATAYPDVPELVWTSDSTNEIISRSYGGVNVLNLENVSINSAKNYTCRAFLRSKSSQVINQTTEVEVLVPPTITEAPESKRFPGAMTVKLTCSAAGNPEPKITWLKDGKPLVVEGRFRLENDALLLSSTIASDSGIYQCVACNIEGCAWAAARLVVNSLEHQHSPPSDINCTTLSNASIEVVWTQPAESSIQAYTVHYWSANGGELSQVTKLKNYTINNLKPFTNYSIFLRSYTNKASSAHSFIIHCVTDEAVPVAAPELTIMPVSTTSAQVSWKPLPPKEAQGVIIEYKIQWRKAQQASINVELVPGNTTDYTITGLLPGQRYEVRVTGATRKGWPTEDFDWTEIEMPVSVIPPQPDLRLFIINTKSIQAQWSYKWHIQNLTGFKLSYQKKDSVEPLNTLDLPANQSEFVINDLEMRTWYEVFLNARTPTAEGEIVSRSIHTFPQETGDTFPVLSIPAPTDLEAEPSSPTSINLTWTPPSNVNVSFYTIAYQVVSSAHLEDDELVSHARSTSNEIELTNLKPATLYEMKVRTHDYANSFSEYSRKLEVKTKQEAPTKVQNVEWKTLNRTSIKLNWRKPAITNGAILRYIVSYTQDPLASWHNFTVSGDTTFTEVTGLESNVAYFVRVQAETNAGISPISDITAITIAAYNPGLAVKNNQQSLGGPDQSPTVSKHDQFLGVVVGCSIGMCCIALCTATLVLRRQCGKPHTRCANGNRPARDLRNGNGFYHEQTACTEHHEMQCLAQHMDSKGGYQIGPLNGLRSQLLNNTCIPNGPLTSIRITENPHFLREFDRDCGEGDSLLSGPLNETQLTALGLNIGEGSGDREEGGDSGLGNDRTESDHGLDVHRCSQTESDLAECRLNYDSCKIELDEDSNQNNEPCSYYRFNNYKRPCSPQIKKYSDLPVDDGFCENHCFSHYPSSHLASTTGPSS